MQTIFDRIDRILVDKRMSRRKLARLAGIPETTLASAFSRRPNKFPVEYTQRIAAALDVPLDSLIELEYTEDGPRIPPTEEERELERMDAELAHDVLTGKTSPEDARILKPYRHLNSEGQKKVVAYASDLEGNPKYQRIK